MHKILFYIKFISYLYMFRATCAHRQEVKIVLFSLWYHHTETSEWSKITKITKIIKIVVILVILYHILVSFLWKQKLYKTNLNSWRWAHIARNTYRHEISLLLTIVCALCSLITKINPKEKFAVDNCSISVPIGPYIFAGFNLLRIPSGA